MYASTTGSHKEVTPDKAGSTKRDDMNLDAFRKIFFMIISQQQPSGKKKEANKNLIL